MADETSQKEPSMEEILASIRRIISEDGDEKEKPEAAQAEAVAKSTPAASVAPVEAPAPAGAGDEVLELTEEVDEDGNVVDAGAPEQAAPVIEASEPAPEAKAELAAILESTPQTPESAVPLMENVAEDAVAGAFAALASQVGPKAADQNTQQITPAGRTIEDHVLEMLRPMLREWLDQHLPQMVQRLIQREIDRIIQRSDQV